MKYALRSSLAILLLVLILLVAREITKTPQFEDFSNWISRYFLVAVLFLILYRTLSTLIPLLPPDLFTFISIPIFGLPVAFIVDVIGGTAGSIAAYAVGKNRGLKIIGYFVGHNSAEKVKKLKVAGRHDLLLLVLAKTMYLGLFSSPASYLAGIERMKISHLIIGSIVAQLLLRIPIFILGETFLFDSTPNTAVILFVILYSVIGSLIVYRHVNK